MVYGHPSVATYYFAGGRLLSVLVDVQNMQLRHTRDNVEIARDVENGLTDYYGAPKVCADTGKGGLARLDCRWVVRGVQVGLSYVDYGGLSPSLTVAARPMPPKKRAAPIVFSRRGIHEEHATVIPDGALAECGDSGPSRADLSAVINHQ